MILHFPTLESNTNWTGCGRSGLLPAVSGHWSTGWSKGDWKDITFCYQSIWEIFAGFNVGFTNGSNETQGRWPTWIRGIRFNNLQRLHWRRKHGCTVIYRSCVFKLPSDVVGEFLLWPLLYALAKAYSTENISMMLALSIGKNFIPC